MKTLTKILKKDLEIISNYIINVLNKEVEEFVPDDYFESIPIEKIGIEVLPDIYLNINAMISCEYSFDSYSEGYYSQEWYSIDYFEVYELKINLTNEDEEEFELPKDFVENIINRIK